MEIMWLVPFETNGMCTKRWLTHILLIIWWQFLEVIKCDYGAASTRDKFDSGSQVSGREKVWGQTFVTPCSSAVCGFILALDRVHFSLLDTVITDRFGIHSVWYGIVNWRTIWNCSVVVGFWILTAVDIEGLALFGFWHGGLCGAIALSRATFL